MLANELVTTDYKFDEARESRMPSTGWAPGPDTQPGTTTNGSGKRAEQRAATRRRLLDATIESLYELGYARTTTLEVQARAGVSRGTLLHQFGSRTELVMAAIDHLGAARYAAMHEQALRLPRGATGFDVAVEVTAGMLFAPISIAAMELWNASRTDDELAEALRRHEPMVIARMAELFGLLVGPEIAADPRYPAVRETVLWAMVGSALGRHLRPEGWLERAIELWKIVGRGLGAEDRA